MTILTFFAIAPIIVIVTLLLASASMDEKDPAFVAVLILFLWIIAIISFKNGADWQHAHTLERYTLTAKP
jgi:hypothetical protein